jgi:mycothiol synthase
MNPIPVPGLRFRSFRGEADYPEILSIIAASKEADGNERSDSLKDVARNYSHLHNSDPNRDMLFAEVNGQTVGYTRGWWEIESDGNWLGFHIGWVKPEWRGKGIGRTLLDFVETRLGEIAAEQVKNGQLSPDMPRYFSTDVADTEKAREALLLHTGYRAIRYAFSMTRPDLENIPDQPLPPGLEVRPVLPEHYRQVWDASNEAFRDHWGYIPEPEEYYRRMLEDPSFDPSLWRVAWDGDQVAGMVLSFINKAENTEYNRKRGYTENICVRRPWRGKGLAKALIALSLQAIKERGMDHAALGVDAENISGALQLYESMGYQVVKRMSIYRKAMK